MPNVNRNLQSFSFTRANNKIIGSALFHCCLEQKLTSKLYFTLKKNILTITIIFLVSEKSFLFSFCLFVSCFLINRGLMLAEANRGKFSKKREILKQKISGRINLIVRNNNKLITIKVLIISKKGI